MSTVYDPSDSITYRHTSAADTYVRAANARAARISNVYRTDTDMTRDVRHLPLPDVPRV